MSAGGSEAHQALGNLPGSQPVHMVGGYWVPEVQNEISAFGDRFMRRGPMPGSTIGSSIRSCAVSDQPPRQGDVTVIPKKRLLGGEAERV